MVEVKVLFKYIFSKLWLLLISIGCYAAIGIHTVSEQFPELAIAFTLPDVFLGAGVALFFITLFIYFQLVSDSIELFNVEQLFRYIIWFGLVSLVINIIPEIVLVFQIPTVDTTFWESFYPLISSFFLVLYFTVALTLLKKLIFLEKNETVTLAWYVFAFLLFVSTGSNVKNINVPDAVIYLSLIHI